jgi:hypothetical protein
MWLQPLKFRCSKLFIFLIIPPILVAGCRGNSQSSEIKTSDVDVRETENITEPEIQTRILENCDGVVEYKQTVSQGQSVNKSTEISTGGRFGVGGLKVIEAAVEAKYENTRREGRTAEDKIELVALPETNVRYTIIWVWVEYSGNVIIKGEPDSLDYRYRQLVEVKTSPENLGCDDAGIAAVSTESVSIDSPTPQPDSPDIEEAVSKYLIIATQVEIIAYSNMDASLAESVFAGQQLEVVRDSIEELRDAGFYYVPEFDFANSYYRDIRIVNETTIEVDSCEFWTGAFYRVSDNGFVEMRERELLPQTITIEYIGNRWYISKVVFYGPPYFCESKLR